MPADGATNAPPVGRFAPSPTGPLHTGSLATAVGSWLMARSRGGRWHVRMDDLDRQRQVPGMADDILATLEEFGLFWDGDITWQSRNLSAYGEAFERLRREGRLFACGCSRQEIARAASAPHPDDNTPPYPGTCRTGLVPGKPVRSWRVRVPDEEICFEDLARGRICQNLAISCGAFPVARGNGEFTYQLAVVVDDHLTGVTQVVRGEDLIGSTPRQIHLQRLLGLPQPAYCHLPLVTAPGGEKLSKRDNLVSHRVGNWRGKEGELLRAVLDFLGHPPPPDLDGTGCGEILEWAVKNFDLGRVPPQGGQLVTEVFDMMINH